MNLSLRKMMTLHTTSRCPRIASAKPIYFAQPFLTVSSLKPLRNSYSYFTLFVDASELQFDHLDISPSDDLLFSVSICRWGDLGVSLVAAESVPSRCGAHQCHADFEAIKNHFIDGRQLFFSIWNWSRLFCQTDCPFNLHFVESQSTCWSHVSGWAGLWTMTGTLGAALATQWCFLWQCWASSQQECITQVSSTSFSCAPRLKSHAMRCDQAASQCPNMPNWGVLGHPKTYFVALLRLSLPAMPLAASISNTCVMGVIWLAWLCVCA